MALYFALPFGVYALAKLVNRHKGNYIMIGLSIAGLIAVFIGTLLAVWSPFIYYGGIDTVHDILYRIFPVRRGIFEGKVATLWCMVNHCGLSFLKVN
jgi:alpha-1,3-glucosyltransferase